MDKPMKMDVPRPVYLWLLQLRTDLTKLRGRQVTYPEVWEHVKAEYEAAKAGRP